MERSQGKAGRVVKERPPTFRAVAEGAPEPEDAEAAAAFALEHEARVGGLPLDAIRILFGEAPEAGAVASVRSLLEAVDARVESATG